MQGQVLNRQSETLDCKTHLWLLNRSGRLCKDYETQIPHNQMMVVIAMSHLMLKQLHNKGNFQTGSKSC